MLRCSRPYRFLRTQRKKRKRMEVELPEVDQPSRGHRIMKRPRPPPAADSPLPPPASLAPDTTTAPAPLPPLPGASTSSDPSSAPGDSSSPEESALPAR